MQCLMELTCPHETIKSKDVLEIEGSVVVIVDSIEVDSIILLDKLFFE